MKRHSKPKHSSLLTNLLPYGIAVVIGAGMVSLLSILFPRFMRCPPLNDVPSWLGQAALLAISQILPSLISLIIPKIPKISVPHQKTIVALTIAAGVITFLVVRFSFPTPNETVCYPELKIIYGLIDAEKNAVLNEDISQIEAIYSSAAVIENIALDKKWGNPSLYYGAKFKDEVHCSIIHSHYTIVQLTSTEAIITTSSSGTWGIRAKANGCPETYINPAGSDYWTFKNIDAQWRISSFRFNCYANPDKCK
jgi:hypothetical protein